MPYQFEVERFEAAQGSLVAFGPIDSGSGRQLHILSESDWLVTYKNPRLRVIARAVFAEQRLEISQLTIQGEQGEFIASRDLTQLNLPAVLRKIGLLAVTDSDFWNVELEETKLEGRKTPEFLAQVYWFEYATWGSPRQALIDYLSVSRTTANTYIRKFASLLPLPGAHATKVLNK